MSRCDARGQGRGWVIQKPDGSELVLDCQASSLGDTGAQSEEEAGGCKESMLRSMVGVPQQGFIHKTNTCRVWGGGETHTQGNGQTLSLSQKCPHTGPRGSETKRRMPGATDCSIPTISPLSTPIQDPLGEGWVGRLEPWVHPRERARPTGSLARPN